jgi:NAD(P)-dependent dehydrogenase (short-subunit alcohol dehydrogenase family)
MKLKDRIELITGAGRGIGQALAEGFAREGVQIRVNSEFLGKTAYLFRFEVTRR